MMHPLSAGTACIRVRAQAQLNRYMQASCSNKKSNQRSDWLSTHGWQFVAVARRHIGYLFISGQASTQNLVRMSSFVISRSHRSAASDGAVILVRMSSFVISRSHGSAASDGAVILVRMSSFVLSRSHGSAAADGAVILHARGTKLLWRNARGTKLIWRNARGAKMLWRSASANSSMLNRGAQA